MKRFVDVPKADTLKPWIDPKLKEIIDDEDVWPAFRRMMFWLLMNAIAWAGIWIGLKSVIETALKHAR